MTIEVAPHLMIFYKFQYQNAKLVFEINEIILFIYFP